MNASGGGLPAMVMTAGLGTRLRPLTCVRAKPAVPVAGEPLVRRILRWLASGGVTRAVLNLHHLPDTIRTAVGDGEHTGVRVAYSPEDPILGSGGGPRHALPLLGTDRFLIVNGDTLTDLDLGPLVEAHIRSGALVTLALTPNPAPARYGGVELDGRGQVVRFARAAEAGPDAHLFIGVQVVEARAFEFLTDGRPAETIRHLYPALMASRPGSVRGFVGRASFFDIGTPRDYLATSLALAAREPDPGRPVGRGSVIHPSASLLRTVVWDEVVIEAGASLDGCIVTDRVRVPAGAHWSDVALTPASCGLPLPESSRDGDLVVTPIPPSGDRRAEAPALRGSR